MSDRRPAHAAGRLVFVGGLLESEPAFRVVLESTVEVVALVTFDEALRERTPGSVDLTRLAKVHGVPILTTTDPEASDLVPQVRGLAPTLLVCVGWPQHLDPDLLVLPRYGSVGFHGSLLPHNRGSSPITWAMLHGETGAGSTMVMLVPGVGNGDIVDQREVVIGPDDTYGTVYDRVAQAGAKMLREHLSGLLTGTAPRRRQVVHHFDRKLPRRIPEMDVTSFARTSVEVNNWIRALTRPGTGAFGYIRGQRLVLWKAEALEGRTTRAPAGTVLGADGDGVVVTTRTGAVRLLEVQADGRRPESAAAWFARTGWKPGCVFDAVDAATLAWSLGKGPRPDPHTDVSPERRELRKKGSRS